MFIIAFLILKSILVLNAISTYAPHAQCNPLHDRLCLVRDRALSSTIFDTLTRNSPHFVVSSTPNGVLYDQERGLELTIAKAFDQPTLVLQFSIMFGRVEIDMQASPGTGIISSLYLQSDQFDRIYIAETFGSDAFEYQTNFFIKGNITGRERAMLHQVGSPPIGVFHRYGVEWTSRGIKWLLDGKVIRTSYSNSSLGVPDAPMRLEMSLWAGGDDHNSKGMVLWLGGITDYAIGPFKMNLKNLYVADYSTGREYMYGNIAGGKWMDVTSVGGRIHRGPAPRGRSRPMTVDEQNRLPLAVASRKRARHQELAHARERSRQTGLNHKDQLRNITLSAHTDVSIDVPSALPSASVRHDYANGNIPSQTRSNSHTLANGGKTSVNYTFVQSGASSLPGNGSFAPLSKSYTKTMRRVQIYRRSWKILPADRIPFPIDILQRKRTTSAVKASAHSFRAPRNYWVIIFIGLVFM